MRAMLAEDVVWHAPGRSAIAGDHRGRGDVLRYLARRRELARATLRIEVRGVIADAEGAVILAGDEGERLAWGTVGVFRVADGKIAECWGIPNDQDAFDRVCSARSS